MQKKSYTWLITSLGLLLFLATGCGGATGPTNTSSGSKAVVANRHLYVLAGAAPQNAGNAPAQIVSLQPGSSTSVKLPNGLRAIDPWLLYTAVPARGSTRISVIDLRDASVLRSFTIPGTYVTDWTMFDHAVLSFDGQWLALRAQPDSANQTTIALVDTQADRLVNTIRLNGDFDLDAVSPDGSRIYLLQRFHDGTSRYYVRLYQVPQQQLLNFPIVDKTNINEQMDGMAVARQVAADGSKVFTLYINPALNKAFVHVLPLTGNYLGARCLDLPTGSDSSLLHFYTLALRTYTDGTSTLYVANGALGTVLTINVSPNDEVFNMNVNAVAHFTPAKASITATERARQLYNGAALSQDEQTLFFAGLQGIWSVKTNKLSDSAPAVTHYLANEAITSLGMSSDGATLYAMEPARGILTLDARTGQAGPVLQTPVQAPWGIVWIE